MSVFVSAFRLAVLGCTAVLVVLPSTTAAAANTTPSRAALFEQIEDLRREVDRLKTVAKAEPQPLVSATGEVYHSLFFDQPFEAVYGISGTNLSRLDAPRSGIRAGDQQLFNLFKGVIGPVALAKHIDEFRVFAGESEELSAFVEIKAGTADQWIVGVNRSDFDLNDSFDRVSIAYLFVHEYAHVLFLDDDAYEAEFAWRFWTTADTRHSERLDGLADRWLAMGKYYDKNSSRFVSEYATANLKEDMAETFQVFVTTPRPEGYTLREHKIRFMYESPSLVAERAVIRENLRILGVL